MGRLGPPWVRGSQCLRPAGQFAPPRRPINPKAASRVMGLQGVGLSDACDRAVRLHTADALRFASSGHSLRQTVPSHPTTHTARFSRCLRVPRRSQQSARQTHRPSTQRLASRVMEIHTAGALRFDASGHQPEALLGWRRAPPRLVAPSAVARARLQCRFANEPQRPVPSIRPSLSNLPYDSRDLSVRAPNSILLDRVGWTARENR